MSEDIMKKNHSVGLEHQLTRYSSSAKSGATLAALKQRLGNWSTYATATGSVMAMATSASAGIIPYTGVLPPTLGLPEVGQGVNSNPASHPVPFPPGQTFLFRIGTSNQGRTAFASAGASLQVLHKSAGGLVLENLTPGQTISSKAGMFGTGHSVLKFVKSGGEWTAGKPGFEGFRFATADGNYDYGWAELELGVDGNGVLDSLTLLGLAYNDTNGPIDAGQTSESPDPSPEPGTAGLMLLALGAAGVTILRNRRIHRKQQAAQA
jgi:PEP-CTERM motif